MHYWLVMPAAGTGRRFGDPLPKQYAPLLGRTVIEWALAPFLADRHCAGLAVALAAGDTHWSEVAARLSVPVTIAAGGAERSGSVLNALRALQGQAQEEDWVLVHDAARPCLAAQDLSRLLCLKSHPVGGLLACAAADTLKFGVPGVPGVPARGPADGTLAAEESTVERTVDRTGLWRALTPQMFRLGALRQALESALAAGRHCTDEAQALEWMGARPVLVEGSAANIKITTARDLAVAAALLSAGIGGVSGAGRGWPQGAGERAAGERAAGEQGTREHGAGGTRMRIGSGFDVHTFGEGNFVMLGGVRVPYSRGVVAHSDGDVLLHALCDALLGAAGLGDIGQHFRDDDPKWRGADSRGFVRAVMELIGQRGLAVVNADFTVLAEAPRLSRHREEIRHSVAALLQVAADCVNVKATTTEKMGFLGRGEGLAAHAVVLLRGA